MVCSTEIHNDCDHDEYVAAAKKVLAKIMTTKVGG